MRLIKYETRKEKKAQLNDIFMIFLAYLHPIVFFMFLRTIKHCLSKKFFFLRFCVYER